MKTAGFERKPEQGSSFLWGHLAGGEEPGASAGDPRRGGLEQVIVTYYIFLNDKNWEALQSL